MPEPRTCRSDANRACTCRGSTAEPIPHAAGSEAWLREAAERHRRAVSEAGGRGSDRCCGGGRACHAETEQGVCS